MPSSTRARLLFLSHRLPFPPHSGAAIRTYNTLRELSSEFDVDAVCFDRKDAAIAPEALSQRVAEIRRFGSCDVFPIPAEKSRLRFVADHLRSVFTQRPYTWYTLDSRQYVRRVKELLSANRYALIHVDSLDLVRMLEFLPGDRVVCTHHNVESALLRRRGQREESVVRRAYFATQAELLRRSEERWCPRVALNLCTSEDDARALGLIAPQSKREVVPNGVDDEYFRSTGQPRVQSLVFVGGTSWHPNRDALEWYASEVAPAIRSVVPEATMRWVGRSDESDRKRFGSGAGIDLVGYVDDVRPYLDQAKCFVAPIRVGGGTRLKILDAWAMGTPIVATRAAMAGLSAVDGTNVLLAETPAEFASQVSLLYAQPQLAAKIGMAGRRTVEESYAWRVVGRRLRDIYSSFR